MDYQEKIKAGWIHCNIIIELLGKPKEYIEQVMKAMIEKIKNEKNMMVIKSRTVEPREKEEGKYYTTFAEMEIVIENMTMLQQFIFAYLPSSVEILSPAELKINLNDANYLFNDLSGRLHEYDDLTKQLKVANILMQKKLKELKPDISDKDFDFEEEKKPESKPKESKKEEPKLD